MTMSRTGSDSLVQSNALDLESSFVGVEDNEVVRLREWGTNQFFALRAPQDLRQVAVAAATVLQPPISDRTPAIAMNNVEFLYEGQTWRVRDLSGVASLRQDGSPTREVRLTAGTEVGIAHRTFIAESARSIALRNFCSRLLGWGDDRIAVVDRALRAIRLASAGRAVLVLRGRGELIWITHSIHRHTLGGQAPFVVSDPRRKNTVATVRGPANYACGLEALRWAARGTLCVHAERLPRDYRKVLRVVGGPENDVRLAMCTEISTRHAAALFDVAAQIDIPDLDARRSDLPRIVSEYIEDAMNILSAPDGCLDEKDINWILERSALGNRITIPGIEKAVLRMVAIRMTESRTDAARLLGVRQVSLENWIRRRR